MDQSYREQLCIMQFMEQLYMLWVLVIIVVYCQTG